MSEFPSLPLFTDAFLADTTHLTAQETGAYLLLLMMAWRMPDCALPDDDRKLARWARVDARHWRRVKPVVMEFWVLSSGVWTQKRLLKERSTVANRVAQSRVNGQLGGRPKLLINNDPPKPAGSSQINRTQTGTKAPIPIPIPKDKKDSPLSPQFGIDKAWLDVSGSIQLSDDERQHWLKEFGSGKRLDLALEAALPYVQPNSRVPFLKQVRAQLARAAAEKIDRDARHTSAVKANAPRPRGAPPKDFNFSRSTTHDTQDNSDPVTRYPDHTPEFMAEVDRLYVDGCHADAEEARRRGWVKIKESHRVGKLADRIARGVAFKLAAKEQ